MRFIPFLQLTCIIVALGCSSEATNHDHETANAGSPSGGNANENAGDAQGGGDTSGRGNLNLPGKNNGGAGSDLDAGAEAGTSNEGGADGNGGTDGNGGSSGQSSDADGGVDPGPDETAPTVVSVSPEAGADGVTSDTEIVIEFSEAMNTQSVEAAFNLGTLPSVDFAWSSDDTTLTVTPSSPLVYEEGFDTSVVAKEYEFGLDALAEDLAGNALAAASYTFTTLRRISTTLSGDPNLDGFSQADGLDDLNYGDELVVGSSNDIKIAGFVTIDISSLPSGIAAFDLCRLHITQTATYQSYGAYDDLGDVSLEHVVFSAINTTAVNATALHNLGVISTTVAVETKQRNVCVALQDDYTQRVTRDNLSQYRLTFPDVGASDAGYVVTGFATAEAASYGPDIGVTYLLP